MAELPINKVYLSRRVLGDALKSFGSFNPRSISLRNFISAEAWRSVQRDLSRVKWKRANIPDRRSYSISSLSSVSSLGFLRSDLMVEIVSQITGSRVRLKWELLAFQHRDYTLLHDAERQRPGIYVELELTRFWPDEAGGFTSIVKKGDELIRLAPVPNALHVVDQPRGALRFTKYVNHFARNSRRIIVRGTER